MIKNKDIKKLVQEVYHEIDKIESKRKIVIENIYRCMENGSSSNSFFKYTKELEILNNQIFNLLIEFRKKRNKYDH